MQCTLFTDGNCDGDGDCDGDCDGDVLCWYTKVQMKTQVSLEDALSNVNALDLGILKGAQQKTQHYTLQLNKNIEFLHSAETFSSSRS